MKVIEILETHNVKVLFRKDNGCEWFSVVGVGDQVLDF